MAKGMANYIDQETDRKKWQQSIQYRQRLIVQLKTKGIKTPKDPNQMRIDDLKALLKGGTTNE